MTAEHYSTYPGATDCTSTLGGPARGSHIQPESGDLLRRADRQNNQNQCRVASNELNKINHYSQTR
jgi:hypothetical protein